MYIPLCEKLGLWLAISCASAAAASALAKDGTLHYVRAERARKVVPSQAPRLENFSSR